MIKNPTEKQLNTLIGIIYLIINKINNKCYVGQTVHTFRVRYKKNKWWKYTTNSYLKNSVKKYGLENFEIIILKYGKTIKELNTFEENYIKKYNSIWPNGYNFVSGGENKKMHENTKRKFSNINSKTYKIKEIFTQQIYTIKNLSKFCKENNISLSCVWSMAVGQTLRAYNYCRPETTINEILECERRAYKRFEIERTVFSPDGKEYKFINISKFCKEHNLDSQGMSYLLRGIRLVYRGWKMNINDKRRARKRKYKEIILFDTLTNKEIIINSIPDFCKSIGKYSSALSKLLLGKLDYYKNYRLIKITYY